VSLSVGPNPATSVIVSFASSTSPSDTGTSSPPIGGVLIGKVHLEEESDQETTLTRLVVEKEPASWYNATEWFSETHVDHYASPYYHHVLVDELEPDTFYSYQLITREELSSMQHLQEIMSEQSASQAKLIAEQIDEQLLDGEENNNDDQDEEEGFRRRQEELHQAHRQEKQQQRQHRRLAPPPYDSTQCKCPDPNQIRSFRTAPNGGDSPHDKNLKFAVIGDIGQFAHSQETVHHLKHHHGADIVDFVLLAGDLAYPEMNHQRWDTFLDFFDDFPFFDQVPLQITPGNHDIDKADHNGLIFQAFETRFRMPRIQRAERGTYDGPDGRLNMDNPPYPLPYEYGNAYYSFRYGTVHVIVLSSYSSMEPNSKQYDWFVTELASSVDRTVTPWLFVMMHCPIYNTFEKHQRDSQVLAARENLEELFVDHQVNVVFTGHVHAYLRTSPVAYGTLSPKGPIHVVMGAGGRAAEAAFLSEEPEEWVRVRDASIYGYGLVEIYNSTHMRWDWVHTGGEDHANTVKGDDDIELPPGGVDGLVIENQYFVEE